MDELIADFLVEARESLDIIDVALVNFEAQPNDRAALDKIFRLVHTLKGTGGFLGLPRLEALAHAGETLLGRFRDGRLEVGAQAVTLVLRSVDRIKLIIDAIGACGAEPDGEDSDLIIALEALAEGEPAPEICTAVPTRRSGEASLAELDAAFAAAEGPPEGLPSAGGHPGPATDILEPAREAALKEDGEARGVSLPAASGAGAVDAGRGRAEALGELSPTVGATQSIRVSVEVLEDMMTLVSELVLTRNQLLQVNRGRTDETFAAPLQRLSTITGELQDSVMKTRMQPIGAAWNKLPRLVRDLSNELGKKIDLVLEGEATELDRQVLEQIRDPLTHMVRNSADHGLETPTERRAAGKAETGRIRLSAYHEGGSIVIALQDDGRGLDTAKIRDKAVEKGLITRQEADLMNEAQVHRLIFTPGFSTAAAVTAVSGRGVGMDVVRANIEQIGGQVDLQSQAGAGSLITIKIPLTLAIISALIVGVGGQRYAAPQGAVLELIKVTPGSEHRIETIQNIRMVRLRDRLVPLIDLGAELRTPAATEGAFVLIMQVGRHCFGVRVDEVIDTEEIVVKPLAAALRPIPLFSGATILGDGSVVLILDPNGLTERAGAIPAGAEAAAAGGGVQAQDETRARCSVLIVQAGEGPPKAVELSRVTRLENARADQIGQGEGCASLHYRERLMPVLTVAPRQTIRSTGLQPLLVFMNESFAMGLAVDQIIDVVDTALEIELRSAQPGVLGVAMVAGRATEILDIDHYQLLALAEHIRGARGPFAQRVAA